MLQKKKIKNITAKQLGANNLLNNARSALYALQKLATKSDIYKNRDILLIKNNENSSFS